MQAVRLPGGFGKDGGVFRMSEKPERVVTPLEYMLNKLENILVYDEVDRDSRVAVQEAIEILKPLAWKRGDVERPPTHTIVPCDPTPEMICAGHQQIDWCRDKEKTDTPYDESQITRDKYGNQLGTYCGQDLKDAWIAMIRVAPPAPQVNE